MRWLYPALILTAVATPSLAQVVQGVSQTSPTGETTTIFTITPAAGVSATDYVKLSADAQNYQSQAASLALTRAQRDDVKAFAKQVRDHAMTQQQTLLAALSNSDRKITRPSSTLSSEHASDLDLLRKAPRAGFDTLYLKQYTDRAPAVWALQKGYATDGADRPLKQVATSAVPSVEQDYSAARALTPAGADASQ